jgi:hypothetical protein
MKQDCISFSEILYYSNARKDVEKVKKQIEDSFNENKYFELQTRRFLTPFKVFP